MPRRWCICSAQECLVSPIKVDVLMHAKEAYKPTSTGHLIERVIAGAGKYVLEDAPLLRKEDVCDPNRELWLLHPSGDPVPELPRPDKLQVLLIDGSWKQSTRMLQRVETWGRKVNLPMQGESRFWLRSQQGDGRFCTFEAMVCVFEQLGLTELARRARLHLELHVYAGLRLRGNKALAEAYLASSPLPSQWPAIIEALNLRRPNMLE